MPRWRIVTLSRLRGFRQPGRSRAIGRTVVEERLAACINILRPAARSTAGKANRTAKSPRDPQDRGHPIPRPHRPHRQLAQLRSPRDHRLADPQGPRRLCRLGRRGRPGTEHLPRRDIVSHLDQRSAEFEGRSVETYDARTAAACPLNVDSCIDKTIGSRRSQSIHPSSR